MIIIGHNLIDYSFLYMVKNVTSIYSTPPNHTILIKFSQDNVKIIKFCKKNGIEFAVLVKNLTQLAISNAYQPKFLLVRKKLAITAQKFADEYLIDAKILLKSNSYDDIKFVANNFIDGIIFKEGIGK